MKWTIDPAHTMVSFGVTHMGVFTVRGMFASVDGSVTTTDNGAPQSIEIMVDTNSLSTGNAARDQHLHSAEFFDCLRHPVATFKASEISLVAAPGGWQRLFRRTPTVPRYQARGSLSIRGQTHPLILDFTIRSEPFTDSWGSTRLGAHASSQLDRTTWGMNWQQMVPSISAAVLGNTVTLDIDMQVLQA